MFKVARRAMSLYVELKRDHRHCASSPSNLVESWIPDTRYTHPTTRCSVSHRANRNQRCFSQFDRKTDCFQDGELRMARHTWGRTRGGKQVGVPNYLTRDNAAPSIILKAVCGTQTRHGASVNKYQAGS